MKLMYYLTCFLRLACLFEKGFKNQVSSYRPNSTSSAPCKIFEHLIKVMFTFSLHIIVLDQHGFFLDLCTNSILFSFCLRGLQQNFWMVSELSFWKIWRICLPVPLKVPFWDHYCLFFVSVILLVHSPVIFHFCWLFKNRWVLTWFVAITEWLD